MRLKLHELPHHLQNQVAATFFPKAGLKYAHINPPCRPPDPILERHLPNEPLAADQAQESHPGIYSVHVTSYRRRLLDEDNLCEKFHVDALRYAGILPSDAPQSCHIQTTQKKVCTKAEEKTEIVIIIPN